MIKNRNETSAAMDKALKNLEQAKARYEAERKKENEKRRKAQNHHKWIVRGQQNRINHTVVEYYIKSIDCCICNYDNCIYRIICTR